MPYPYGMYNAPVVGNGLGGLPRRATAVVPTPTPTTTYAKYNSIFITTDDRALGFKVRYNNVITDTVGSYKASGNFASTVHAVMRNYPLFTFNQALTGGGNAMFPQGYACSAYVDPNFVSLTYGGESNFNSSTYIWSFTPDSLYRARSASTSTSVQDGFSVDGDSSKYYVIAAGVISIIDKTTLTATVTKSYTGAASQYVGWVYGNNLHTIDGNGRLLVVDKDTLAVVSVSVTGVGLPSSGISQSFAQTSTTVAWVNPNRSYVFVLDKATLTLKSYTIPWSVGSGLYANLFACGDKIVALLFESGASPYRTLVIEFDSNFSYPLYQLQGNNFAEQAVSSSGSFFGTDILSIFGLNVSPQVIASATVYWNTKPSEVTSGTSIPTFAGVTVSNIRSSGTALTSYAVSSGSSTASNSTNTFTTFTKYPYVINY